MPFSATHWLGVRDGGRGGRTEECGRRQRRRAVGAVNACGCVGAYDVTLPPPTAPVLGHAAITAGRALARSRAALAGLDHLAVGLALLLPMRSLLRWMAPRRRRLAWCVCFPPAAKRREDDAGNRQARE